MKRKRMLSFFVSVVMLGMMLDSYAAGAKQSAVEGKVVDWNDKPVAGVTVVAEQVEPIKGYERLEGVTDGDGSFRLDGLYPSSQYVLAPQSSKWTVDRLTRKARLNAAPPGETALLRAPIQIVAAFSLDGGALVTDLATGATRFTISAEGVITDSKTGLEWIVAPEGNTQYQRALQWVASCAVAGGGWRMPTTMELRDLYQENASWWGHVDPVFKTGDGLDVWGERRDASSARTFNFNGNKVDSDSFYGTGRLPRTFGVRSRP